MNTKTLKMIIFSLTIFSILNLSVFAQANLVINYVQTKEKKVTLTFDADLSPYMLQQLKSGKVKSWYNKELIEELKNENIPATLFLTGMWIENYASETKTLSENSLFEIGNHSYSHPAFSEHCYKLAINKEVNDRIEIIKTDELLKKYVQNYVKYFRFPGLCSEKDDVDIVNKNSYTVIGGNILGGDGFQNDKNKIVKNVLRNVRPGSIVVLHMIGGPNAPKTSEAMPIIIKKLREKGYEFVKVSDLIKINEISTTTSTNIFKNIFNIFK